MKYLAILIATMTFVGCSGDNPDEVKQPTTEPTDAPAGDLKSVVKRHIQSDLDLTAADDYDWKMIPHELTGDDSVDYLVTVNLMERAIKEAIDLNRVERMQEMGYMGYYNYLFFVDGATKEITEGVVIPSSPMYRLRVAFDTILGTPKSDFTVDYRVRNMHRRRFMTIENGKINELFQAVIFDGLGTEEAVAFSVRYENGTLNDYNDIVEYEATMERKIIPNLDSTYAYEPMITPTDREIRRWHYAPGAGKYFIKKEE